MKQGKPFEPGASPVAAPGPTTYDARSPASISYVSTRRSAPNATFTGSANAPVFHAYTKSALRFTSFCESVPGSNDVGLCGPSDALIVLYMKYSMRLRP